MEVGEIDLPKPGAALRRCDGDLGGDVAPVVNGIRTRGRRREEVLLSVHLLSEKTGRRAATMPEVGRAKR